MNDNNQRLEALNPKKSFIVQAPAGSGKTELLTQRFLVLLATVKQPEEILAITFTKKSAAEMRARIIHALNNALSQPEPAAAHAKQTWNLGKCVIKHSQELKWNLLENPNRLRIQTIDSFNAYLTKQLPILSNFGATPEITDNSTKLYRIAVQEFLSHLEENVAWSDAIAQLLLHMDNDLNKVTELLMSMLAKRDQWLPYVTMNIDEHSLREQLESHLASVTLDILTSLQQLFPKDQTDELIHLIQFAANNLLKENISSNLTACADLSTLPSDQLADKTYWLGISELLLTSQFEWRKRIDKSLGFPAPSNSKNPDEKYLFQHYKQRMTQFLESLHQHDKLKIAFEELSLSPSTQYQEHQWKTLNALQQILRVMVAQLKVVFQQHGKIDYTESAQAALLALGTEDAPTDITLALDYQIKHLLIDEFQDTSTSQYRLIEKLTAGWQPQDGRTLFLVGDPMQSIYRFREAEVGLFIRARKHGLFNIPLVPLTLSVNFRSTAGIVNWVNQHFKQVFPAFEDIAMGAVSYSPSTANTLADSAHPNDVELHPLMNSDDTSEADAIIKLILATKQEKPCENIAVLVRSRSHLISLIPALKNANLNFRAIDIDPLDTRPVILDLIALTRALLHPADRIAWLAILRAPWCGLLLSDLLIISNKPHVIIWEQLNSFEIIKQLSADGQQRIKRFLSVIKTKMADRQRYSLRLWLESTWLSLGGPASVNQLSDLKDATAYFALLEKLDLGGDLADMSDLQRHVSQLYASADHLADNSLQIMTIHNAKGLEFDTVILPHLERKSPTDDKQLLLWMERPQQNGANALILAPIQAIGQEKDSIYDYIKRQHNIKINYETARLLYVAATRAKKKLHLFFSIKTKQDELTPPLATSLLEKLWPTIHYQIKSQFAEAKKTIPDTLKEIVPAKRRIQRLSLDWKIPLYEKTIDSVKYHQKQSGFKLPDHHLRHLGIVIHRALEQTCRLGSTWWINKTSNEKLTYLTNHLTQLGMLMAEQTKAAQTALKAIENTLNDSRGQWIIQSHHEAQSEYRITALIDNEIKELVMDRTFIDEHGTRWIIDYKTSVPIDEDLQQFITKEKNKYDEQLNYYAKAMQTIENRPIRLGLYFPLLPAWCEWT